MGMGGFDAWKRGGIVKYHIRGAQSAGGKARGLGGLRR